MVTRFCFEKITAANSPPDPFVYITHPHIISHPSTNHFTKRSHKSFHRPFHNSFHKLIPQFVSQTAPQIEAQAHSTNHFTDPSTNRFTNSSANPDTIVSQIVSHTFLQTSFHKRLYELFVFGFTNCLLYLPQTAPQTVSTKMSRNCLGEMVTCYSHRFI